MCYLQIYFSHNNDNLTAVYPENVIMKPLTRSINENGVEFEDNTSCCVDVIFYCTGNVDYNHWRPWYANFGRDRNIKEILI